MLIKKKNILAKILMTIILGSPFVMLSCQVSSDNENNGNSKPVSNDFRSNTNDHSTMALIPEGKFIFGNNHPDLSGIQPQLEKLRKWGEDQKPQQNIFLPAFYMDKYEVTHEQYQKFKKNHAFSDGKNNHPAVNVTWFDAKAYCESLGKRLPTEEEWEKAARGPEGNTFSWGNKFNKDKANSGFSKISSSAPVGTFPKDVSFYNVFDMTGNVSEWTSSWYQPYKGSKFKNTLFGENLKVSRGGSFQDMGHYELEIFSTSTFRYFNKPEEWAGDTGFRCAKDVK